MKPYDPYENDPNYRPPKWYPLAVTNHDPLADFKRKRNRGFEGGTYGAFFCGMGPLLAIAIIFYFLTR
jgi:hypothetical protein